MTHIKAMKLAQAWFERNTYGDEAVEEYEALVQAITEAEQAQPVGEVLNERGEVDWISFVPVAGTHLYTTPPAERKLEESLAPRQPWVGLTDEEINAAASVQSWKPFARAIEAKLKEKNT